MSIDHKFPSGNTGQSLTRMRTTINKYSKRLSQTHWYVTFKLPTLKALKSRLVAHDTKINQSCHVEMIAAYKSLVRRISSILGLFRSLTHWKNSQVDSELGGVLCHMRILEQVLNHFGVAYSPDLMVIKFHAEFQVVFEQTTSVSKAWRGWHATAKLHSQGAQTSSEAWGESVWTLPHEGLRNRSMGAQCEQDSITCTP